MYAPGRPSIGSIVEHVDQHHIAQQRRYLRGLDVAPRRHPALAALGEPIVVNLVHFLRAKVNVNVVFAGNQEASQAQLKVKKVAAAGVNSTILARYSRREGFEYRALWTSDLYQDLCIMANPKVPQDKVAAVRAAFINMAKDPEGRQILQAGAELLKSNSELGFIAAENSDYDNYRKFYRTTLVK